MAKAETDIVHAILLACCDGESVALWKNVRGSFRPLHGDQNRVIAAGLSAPGSSDLIGLKRVTITPEMVGQTVAVFTAIEVKAGSSVRPDQVAFLGKVRRYGGIAGVAYCVDDAVKLLAGPAIE